jgi:hypothetical protein
MLQLLSSTCSKHRLVHAWHTKEMRHKLIAKMMRFNRPWCTLRSRAENIVLSNYLMNACATLVGRDLSNDMQAISCPPCESHLPEEHVESK